MMHSTPDNRQPKRRLKVWYDGACPLCVREIALMQRLDRGSAVNFVDIANGADPSCPVDRTLLLERLHAEEDGRIESCAEAFAAMWRAIPAMRTLGLLARNRAVLSFLEWLYRRFLKVRPALQRLLR